MTNRQLRDEVAMFRPAGYETTAMASVCPGFYTIVGLLRRGGASAEALGLLMAGVTPEA